MPQAATPSSVRVRWMNSRTAGSRRQGGEGRVELGDVVLGAGGLDAGEDVDGPVAEFEAMAEGAGLEMGGPTMARRMPTERVNTPGGMAAACWFQPRASLGFFRSRKTLA